MFVPRKSFQPPQSQVEPRFWNQRLCEAGGAIVFHSNPEIADKPFGSMAEALKRGTPGKDSESVVQRFGNLYRLIGVGGSLPSSDHLGGDRRLISPFVRPGQSRWLLGRLNGCIKCRGLQVRSPNESQAEHV